MRKFLILSCLVLLSACMGQGNNHSSESGSVSEKISLQQEKKNKVCSPDTVLAEGKGLKVTLADYRYVESLLSNKSKSFFSAHPEELLKRMINRRLVVKYVEDSGLAKKYGLDKEIEAFKKDYLSRLFVSEEAAKRVKPVTDQEIVERFKELFPKKDPSKMSKGDKDFIRNELKVKHYDEAVASIYGEVEKKLKFKRKGDVLTISCCGIELSEKIRKGEKEKFAKERLKERFFQEYFYRKALKAGLDKNPEFQRMLTEYFASKAIEVFRKDLEKSIRITPDEVKEFYQQNRNKFYMPDRVKAVVILVDSKKKAKEVKKLLESGKPWQEVARRFANFRAQPKFYFKDTKDPVGALLFAEGKPKKGEVLIAQFGEKTYAVVNVLDYVPGGVLPFKRVKRYARLVLKEKKLRELEEKKLKELWKKYDVRLENLDCLRGSS